MDGTLPVSCKLPAEKQEKRKERRGKRKEKEYGDSKRDDTPGYCLQYFCHRKVGKTLKREQIGAKERG